jgi:thiamine biosynthesis lipoprotein
VILAATFATAALLARGSLIETRFEYTAPHMGTTARLVVYASNRAQADTGARAVFARIAELEARLSDYREDSELAALDRSAGGPPVVVSRDLFQILSRAQDMARRSEGAFDVTAGALSRLWRTARRRGELPDPAEIVAARVLVGHSHLELLPAARRARLDRPGMRLDLGGIAKGYAADEALRVLHNKRLPRSLVVLGGDVVAGSPPPGVSGWTVTLQTPGPPQAALLLADAAASTSGDAEQFLEVDGVRYSHVYDPRTGEALKGRRSVTVVAPEGMDADALATAVSVLGPEKGLALVESVPDAAALIVEEEGGRLRTVSSARFEALARVNESTTAN